MFFFFFSSRRRHTRYWRDWSSDVCSSDLERPAPVQLGHLATDRRGGEQLGLVEPLRERIDRVRAGQVDRLRTVELEVHVVEAVIDDVLTHPRLPARAVQLDQCG